MEICAVIYVSTAVRLLTSDDLSTLLIDARAYNKDVNVTGALIYRDGTFLQYFEGAPADVDKVYQRIKSSRLHKGLIELFHDEIHERQYEGWYMGFTEEPNTSLLRSANDQLKMFLTRLKRSSTRSIGLQVVSEFWTRC